ncbi:MAG: hypothetical protein HC904_04635 [Blastochloris sp.]|nr:hypothetical protein [Blastochloris sp.]
MTSRGRSIWQVESDLREKLRQGCQGLFFLDETAPHILSYVESVKGGFWKRDALIFLEREGIKADLKRRPCPPAGKDWISKGIRSFLKARMRRRGWTG